jgi:hypothetical protein
MPADGGHMACHACRPNIADLPPPPSVALPVRFIAETVAYAQIGGVSASGRDLLAVRPRGPPAA